MRRYFSQIAGVLLTASLALPALLLPAPASAQGESQALAVIASSALDLTDISSGSLRRIFQNYALEHKGERLLPINQPANTRTRVLFDLRVLGLDPTQTGRYWIDRLVRGDGEPPRVVPTPALAVRVVATLPSAIAYVPVSSVNDTVRVLTVDGQSPSDPGRLLALSRSANKPWTAGSWLPGLY
jgi:hypothetical protein